MNEKKVKIFIRRIRLIHSRYVRSLAENVQCTKLTQGQHKSIKIGMDSHISENFDQNLAKLDKVQEYKVHIFDQKFMSID